LTTNRISEKPSPLKFAERPGYSPGLSARRLDGPDQPSNEFGYAKAGMLEIAYAAIDHPTAFAK
jgi:hypothetical protein